MSIAPQAIVMGASAGALDALSAIIPALPADFPLPILLVVHLPADKKSILAELLKNKSRVDVREASDKDALEPGVVYVAPPDYHMLVEKDKSIALSVDEPVQYSRPSIDVLFECAADVYGAGLIGIILTGANNDGAHGLKTIMKEGGVGIVQRPDLAYASAMPAAALAACPNAHAMSLEQIVTHLMQLLDRGTTDVA